MEVSPVSESRCSRRHKIILEKRKKLPLWAQREEFLSALAEHQIVVVEAGTGSGKSTQIPQFILGESYASSEKQIACTQPRRLLATCISRRVAQEMNVKIGEEVGYSVQFEDCSGPKTILKYITDGTLLREALSDGLLQKYRVIIIDEAHLRTLATDILLGYLKMLLWANLRPELKLVIMCTQLEGERFADYFDGARIIKSVPMLQPVEIIYLKEPGIDHMEAATKRAVQILEFDPPGDIFVFLTGEEEIETFCLRLNEVVLDMGDRLGPVKIRPLHSNLSLEMQKMIFKAAPPPTRKGGPVGRRVIVSNDIGESSLSIDGIVYVIDSGLMKRQVYNSRLCVESLQVLPIDKACANLRSGCSRRTSVSGKCFRLYTEKFFEALEPQMSPEILRADLAGTILQLKKLGVNDLLHLDLMNPPPTETILWAVETLKYLGALDREENLTKLGKLMCEFSLDPQMAKMVVSSPEYRCSNEILSIAAMLSVPNCFSRPIRNKEAADEARARLSHHDGDHLTLLNVYHAFKHNNGDSSWCTSNFINQFVLQSADIVKNYLASIMQRLNLKPCSTDFDSPDYYINIRKGILSGFFMQVARLEDSGHYATVKKNHVVNLHPSCCLDSQPKWVVYNDFVLASRNFIRIATGVHIEWLVSVAPHFYRIASITWDQN